MKFHQSAKIVSELWLAIKDETDADKVIFESTELLSEALFYTKISSTPSDGLESYTGKNMPEFKLHHLFTDFENIEPKYRARNAFKAKLYVIRIEPDTEWREICQMRCPSCNHTFSCQNLPPVKEN